MYIVHVSRMPKSSNVTGKTMAIKSTIYGCQQNLLTIQYPLAISCFCGPNWSLMRFRILFASGFCFCLMSMSERGVILISKWNERDCCAVSLFVFVTATNPLPSPYSFSLLPFLYIPYNTQETC